jgi:hypothetical protein
MKNQDAPNRLFGQSMNSPAQLWTSTIKSPFDFVGECCIFLAGCCERIGSQLGVSTLVKEIVK